MATDIDFSQRTKSYLEVKYGPGNTATLNVQLADGRGAKSVKVDRALAAKIEEAQRRMTVTDAYGSKARVIGGAGITVAEMQSLFDSVRDAGNNNGHARYISSGERALLQALDVARDDRFEVRINGVKIGLTGFSDGSGGDGTTKGAEGEFLRQTKALRDDIAKHNLLGIPVPAKAPRS